MWPPLRPYMYSDLYPNSHLHAICTGAVVKYPFICIGFWRREAESVTSSGTEMSVMVRERGGPRELNQGCWCCGGTKMRVVTASLQLWPTWASAGTLSSSQPPPSLIPSFSFSLSLFLSSLPFTPSSAHLHFQIDFWEAPPSAYAQILLALFSHSFYHLTPLLSQKNCRDLDSERCRALPGKGYLRWLNGEEQKTMIRFPTRMQQHRRTQSLNWPKGEVCVCVCHRHSFQSTRSSVHANAHSHVTSVSWIGGQTLALRPRSEVIRARLSWKSQVGGGEKGGAKMRRQNEYNEGINGWCSLEESKDKIKYEIS